MLDNQSFVIGFIAGAIVAFFIGTFITRVQNNRKITRNPGRKIGVEVAGKQSPREIIGSATRATMRMTGWLVLLVLTVGAIMVFLYWVWTL